MRAGLLGRAAAIVVLGGLAGACQSTGSGEGRLFGLVSGPLPPPKPFVVASRPAGPQPYPTVNRTVHGRTDTVLTPAERQALEESLKAAAGRGAHRPRRKPAQG